MDTRELQRLKSKAKRLAARMDAIETGVDSDDMDKSYEEVAAELKIHEIELELQNHALSEAREKSEKTARDYTELFELSPVGLMITDPAGFIKKVNQQAESILHSKRRQLVGQSFARFAAASSRDTFHLHVKNVLRNHLPQNDLVTLSVNNVTKTIRVRSKPYQPSAAGDVQVFTMLEDVTAQYKAEKELELAAAVFTNTTDGIIISDDNQTVIRVNNAVTQITGYSQEELIGVSCQTFFGHLIKVNGDEHCVIFDRRDMNERQEVWASGKNGQQISLHVYKNTLVHDKSGERYHVIFLSENTEQKRYQEELEHSASHDLLTNLPNRSLLIDRLNDALNVCHSQQNILALVFIDLDNFKEINDAAGHYVGDQVLKSLAKRMANNIRTGDFVARLGGDEFVVLFNSLHSKDQLTTLLSRLLDNMKKPISVEGENITATFSAGVVFYPQDERVLPDQLLRQADQAMYTAKQAGKSQVRIFDTTDDKKLRHVYQSANKLELALKNDELVLYYQPIVNLSTQKMEGVEALIRWQRPNGELVTASQLPLQSIPASLALEIDNWVVKEVFCKVSNWQKERSLMTKVNINIGGEFLHQDALVTQLEDLLQQFTEVRPEHIQFEIVESSIIEDFDISSAIITRLKAMGFRFALDDFGTGYSSLNYMRRLPVNTVKIDKSLIDMELMDESQLAMLQCISQMAKANHQVIIVEGTETEEQISVMSKIDCQIAQGYWISPPLSEEQMLAWLFRDGERAEKSAAFR